METTIDDSILESNDFTTANLLHHLVNRAEEISNKIPAAFLKAPLLNDLFEEKNKKRYKSKNIFNSLEIQPNVEYNSKIKNEIHGLYIFGELINNQYQPCYVGISRTVLRRLKQHGWGGSHNQSSLAYLIESKFLNYKSSRSLFTSLESGQIKVRNFKVVVIPCIDDFDLYFLEVAIARILTTKWNSFRTH